MLLWVNISFGQGAISSGSAYSGWLYARPYARSIFS